MTDKSMHNVRTLGVILAGGGSRRMGGCDKFLLKLGGKRIIDHIIDRLAPQVDYLILNANKAEPYTDIALEVVPDIKTGDEFIGPLGGLFTALNYAKTKGYNRILTVPCDTPFIPDDLRIKLSERETTPGVIASSGARIHPVVGYWDLSALEGLRAAIKQGNHKMMDFITSQGIGCVSWVGDMDPFFNVNTEQDLRKAEQLYLKSQLS